MTAELGYTSSKGAPTTDLAALGAEGYRQSANVTPNVKVTALEYVARVTHPSANSWLLYDSTTGSFTLSSTDCA